VTRYSDGYLAGFKDAESRLKGSRLLVDGPESDRALVKVLRERDRPPAGMPAGNDLITVLRRAWVEFEMGRRPATEYHAVIGEVLKRLEKTTLAQPTPRSQS
jgi:hypothetical protein